MNEQDADQTVELEGLSLRAVIQLIDRLRQTETEDQFLHREVELDDAYRHADMDLRLAEADQVGSQQISELQRVREHILKAHDLVGESNRAAAIEELDRIVEIQIGLGGPRIPSS